MRRPREKTSLSMRQQRFENTQIEAAEILAGQQDARQKKTERLRAMRLAVEAKGRSDLPEGD